MWWNSSVASPAPRGRVSIYSMKGGDAAAEDGWWNFAFMWWIWRNNFAGSRNALKFNPSFSSHLFKIYFSDKNIEHAHTCTFSIFECNGTFLIKLLTMDTFLKFSIICWGSGRSYSNQFASKAKQQAEQGSYFLNLVVSLPAEPAQAQAQAAQDIRALFPFHFLIFCFVLIFPL